MSEGNLASQMGWQRLSIESYQGNGRGVERRTEQVNARQDAAMDVVHSVNHPVTPFDALPTALRSGFSRTKTCTMVPLVKAKTTAPVPGSISAAASRTLTPVMRLTSFFISRDDVANSER